jgi:hypothetical protein
MIEQSQRPASQPIRIWLKIFFWLGIAAAAYSCSDPSTPIQHLNIWYPLDAVLFFPGIFINQRRYQAPAVLLFCWFAVLSYNILRS